MKAMLYLCMIHVFLCILLEYTHAVRLWPKGIVYYVIDVKHYDVYSRSMIRDTLKLLEKEVCLKFPPAPKNLKPSMENPVLFISNSREKYKCTSQNYNFNGPVVKMTIGYSCLNNKRALAGNFIHMMKRTIRNKEVCNENSLQLYDKFTVNRTLLTNTEKCFLNHNYFTECMNQSESMQYVETELPDSEPKYRLENYDFYNGLLWPSGVVYYDVADKIRFSIWHEIIAKNMALFEKDSCIKFLDISTLRKTTKKVVKISGIIYFGDGGEVYPRLGFYAGNQTLNITAIASGQQGYLSHTLNLLMRILGVTMMSNRFDRDSYISINNDIIDKGREGFFTKTPVGAWLRLVPYDFKSVTHAPYDYMCSKCYLGKGTVEPVMENGWETVISMGQSLQLSDHDKLTLDLLYATECDRRKAR